MFKTLSLILFFQASILFAQDFTEEFSRRLDRILHPESQLYGTASLRLNRRETDAPLYFRQKLDHFRSSDKTKWRQRFITIETYFKRDGPVFLYVFGNEQASTEALRKSQILGYARDFNAMVIGLEHRFYGDSRPFSNTSLENLDYLNIQQALADIAYLIQSANKLPQLSPNTKWILFGNFYGGSLAAWARMKYPHLIHGAVASSAIVSFSTELPEYLESVKNSYFSYDDVCAKNIASAFTELRDTFKTKDGRDKMSKLFRLCDSLGYTLDDFAILRGILIHDIYTAVEQDHNREYSMSTVCNIMKSNGNSSLENLSEVDSLFRTLKNSDCWHTNKDTIFQHYQEERYERSDQTNKQEINYFDNRLWFYQSCTQIGLDLPSSKSVDMFGKDYEELENRGRYCEEFFGSQFDKETIDEGVRQTNIEFGAKSYNVNRVVFVQGSIDPWASAGIGEKPENAPYDVIRIEGISHRTDLVPSNDNNLRDAVRKIKSLINSWLV